MKNGNIKLADFGWAVHVPQSELRDTFCGTKAYLPPEIHKNEKYDCKVDIWTYGIILYELWHKKTPFEECESKPITKQMVLKKKLEFNSNIDPEL